MKRRAQLPANPFAVALGAVALLSVMDAVMKHLVLAIGILAVSIWRSLANLLLSSALYLPRRLPWPKRRTLKIHVARGVLVTLMAFLFFWGIGRVPLAQAIALTFIAPLIALVLAGMFLDEEIGPRSIAGSLAAFAGVLVIMFGQVHAELGVDVLLGSAAIIGSALCYAGNIVMMRYQALAARPLEINFFQALTVMAVWIVVLPFVRITFPAAGDWVWIAVASALSTTGTLLYGWSYARAEASYLAVTEYSAFLWASILGWLIFSEHLSLFTLAGAVMIVGGCLAAARRKVVPPEIEIAA